MQGGGAGQAGVGFHPHLHSGRGCRLCALHDEYSSDMSEMTERFSEMRCSQRVQPLDVRSQRAFMMEGE